MTLVLTLVFDILFTKTSKNSFLAEESSPIFLSKLSIKVQTKLSIAVFIALLIVEVVVVFVVTVVVFQTGRSFK